MEIWLHVCLKQMMDDKSSILKVIYAVPLMTGKHVSWKRKKVRIWWWGEGSQNATVCTVHSHINYKIQQLWEAAIICTAVSKPRHQWMGELGVPTFHWLNYVLLIDSEKRKVIIFNFIAIQDPIKVPIKWSQKSLKKCEYEKGIVG